MLSILTQPQFIASAISFSVILLLGTLGELLTERAGHLNLGVEGMMLLGGAIGYYAAVTTESLPLALIAACLGSGMGAFMYGFLTVTLRVNQNVTGLALTMFGMGLANAVGSKVAGTSTPVSIQAYFEYQPFHIKNPANELIAYIDRAFLSHDLYVYLTILLAIVMTIFLFRSREGLALRLTGENAAAADASGIKVTRIKYMYIVIGGMLCGLGGLYLPLVQQGSWTDTITAGQGWLVVALVIFVRWHPIKAIFGSFVFGALSILGYSVQLNTTLAKMPIFNQFIMSMFPYILTIIVLVITSARKKAWGGPAEIGHAYFREDR
ncbi:ABC transporter permease [Candidatus Saccharibacteria bacterium]|jgi:simple sugar transport system permease protein|nr:ABC transporter permease [Oscillospiraceae bacterium]NLA43507.1 ABC transporter permease [Candidatus Saccharibacteria bacterium]NLO62402.1 ABC transporter permease [Clostridiaceae bacterium]